MQLGATIPTDTLMEVCLAPVSETVVMVRSLHIAECLESAVASHTVMEVYLVLVLVTEVMVTCHAMVLVMGQVIMIGDNPGLMTGSEVIW